MAGDLFAASALLVGKTGKYLSGLCACYIFKLETRLRLHR